MTETIEGNKLIAEFMGFTFQNHRCYHVAPYDRHPFRYEYSAIDGTNKWTSIERLMFDTSWDWLMPVVEKIESIHDDHHGYFGVHISSNSCSIQGTNLHMALNHSNYGAVYMSDPNAILETKIESTWYNVVQFITWFNTQNK